MLSLLNEDIRHEPNQGNTRIGKQQFAEFLKRMDECYQEKLTDLVFLSRKNSYLVAIEFVVHGVYKKAETGLPEAKNQPYILPAAAFLEVHDHKITRISTHYNLPLWIKLVSM